MLAGNLSSTPSAIKCPLGACLRVSSSPTHTETLDQYVKRKWKGLGRKTYTKLSVRTGITPSFQISKPTSYNHKLSFRDIPGTKFGCGGDYDLAQRESVSCWNDLGKS